MITQFRLGNGFDFFQKLRMGIRQVTRNLEVNPLKGSGVIKIPKIFTFWGGQGFWGKKIVLPSP